MFFDESFDFGAKIQKNVPLGNSILLKRSNFSTPGQTSGVMAPQSWAIKVN